LLAQHRRAVREHNGRAWAAHQTAALIACAMSGKRLPSLRSLMIDDEAPARPQTWQQQRALMRTVLARVGAKPRRRKKR
jgi:hypothetical protein